MAPPKLLIAEDDKVTQALYKKGIPENLCTTKIVGNGQEAIDVYQEWQPDIILLDYSMPIVNGYQALKTIRGSEAGKKPTIIMVTSMADKDNIIACAQLGIQGYLVKPFRTDEIAVKIFQMHKARK
jgi:CheY-like chemotaxis protein